MWLSVWSEVQLVYGPADATATPIISCFTKIQNGFTFLVLAYHAVMEKRLFNECLSVCLSKVSCLHALNDSN